MLLYYCNYTNVVKYIEKGIERMNNEYQINEYIYVYIHINKNEKKWRKMIFAYSSSWILNPGQVRILRLARSVVPVSKYFLIILILNSHRKSDRIIHKIKTWTVDLHIGHLFPSLSCLAEVGSASSWEGNSAMSHTEHISLRRWPDPRFRSQEAKTISTTDQSFASSSWSCVPLSSQRSIVNDSAFEVTQWGHLLLAISLPHSPCVSRRRLPRDLFETDVSDKELLFK